MSSLLHPGAGWVSCNDALATALGLPGARLSELGSLPLGEVGQRLVALRYFVANGRAWLEHFAWRDRLAKRGSDVPAALLELWRRVDAVRAGLPDASRLLADLEGIGCAELALQLEAESGSSDRGLHWIVALDRDPRLRARLRERTAAEIHALWATGPRACDLLYLAAFELDRHPATTVGAGALRFVIVADKGEMGVRAVREAIAGGYVPVVLYSRQDDDGALQVRLCEAAGGFGIPLEGTFRESYASFTQITAAVLATYDRRFGSDAAAMLACSALYPGYGPLAENAAAIAHFRRHGIVFVGPTQDVVERAGDKRKFRLLAQSFDERAVTPGIVIDAAEPEAILAAIHRGHAEGRFTFPGRLKAANGGGGRGQAVIPTVAGVPAAVQKVLGEISTNGWDPGVMFEQNVPETIHLEVQVVRDRWGHTRHFGMRDCSEQRASQKIQEEAPPALLRSFPGLQERMCQLAVQIADAVGYVGACTVELMFKEGHFYLLEMNTRIQVEHPVTEEAHRIRYGTELRPLDLVALQLLVASGAPIPFAQSDVVPTHVAREFRINAESWKPNLRDPRDGQPGLFLPNAGIFDTIELPSAETILAALAEDGVHGIADLRLRFDCGFEAGDKLVNKDPTFGKLIVSLATEPTHAERAYELLRVASIAVLRAMKIVGRQVLPDGRIVKGSRFETNLEDHVRILEAEVLRRHSTGVAPGRHVSWVVDLLRRGPA
jgi:acetyl/propionyl-CoA carboxylase alpha subunit